MRAGLRFLVAAIATRVAVSLTTPVYVTNDIQRVMVPASPQPRYSATEQDEDICAAGSRQWTGWVDVSPEKRLFYWFFESRSDPSTDPVMVWLNGGPGGSSMMGLFEEIGPCLTSKDYNGTKRNEHSWTNFANVLFIDQPAGVGFSSVKNGTDGGPDNVLEASRDFDAFLSIFFTEAFPQFASQPFHMTGESFGGNYIPNFLNYIARRQQLGVPGAFQLPVQSITLVDAVIDIFGSGAIGTYDHMCRFGEDGQNRLRLGFNATTCRQIERAIPECERLDRACLDTYDKEICATAGVFCGQHIDSLIIDAGPVPRVPYDDRRVCKGERPLCGFGGQYESWLNEKAVLDKLDAPEGWNFTPINFELNSRWEASKELWLPTVRQMSWILDQTETKVLVLNGNNDIIVNTEGQKRVYDALPWNHQAGFRLESYSDWEWTSSSGKVRKGGEYKAVDKLAFVAIDEAGHTSPGDQREAVAFVMKCWLTGAKHEECPKRLGGARVKMEADRSDGLYNGRMPRLGKDYVW